MNSSSDRGWICPRCNKILAPRFDTCSCVSATVTFPGVFPLDPPMNPPLIIPPSHIFYGATTTPCDSQINCAQTTTDRRTFTTS